MVREYGLCLWTFGEITFEEKCKLAKEIGVSGVEVQGNLSQDPAELKAVLRKHDLKVLSVTPDNVDISSADEQVRSSAVQYFLDLLSWAQELGAQRICLHGDVGKTQGCGDSAKDWELLVKSSTAILQKAEELNVEVVFEVLNRYENHQIVTAEEALRLLDEVKSEKFKVLLDAYHMNIEESCPIKAVKKAKDKLGVYHVADSNRQAVGNGHVDIKGQIEALYEIGYKGPIIMEMTAEGPNPFTPVKDGDYVKVVVGYYKDSLQKIKEWDLAKVSS
ncbi:sugar phosphate isomerase/epimerase family protein [Domibacillus sp. DTU_2020_1001157_1_SI_ALB_TIR_016]|uniref:sugar phosphate isomerase/epimerase family protein n=1 Tax=Domibacillus sp. DTU_2020_1001157_1_SI_ALB_TIR_016 TaxID=3077789 RepID=UPI0028E6BD9E|nr:sugar phosphate isomerase/epimerase family protein [Domibacillus sp. DTU_2020_1001157_1_SI_ALB_TIR_016]WNS77804.1 sugar phosphate isomerase/epimerase family protein [Domibacillus sp. DTU_2020_1001157_1_SI_ALB_TIR_016]